MELPEESIMGTRQRAAIAAGARAWHQKVRADRARLAELEVENADLKAKLAKSA